MLPRRDEWSVMEFPPDPGLSRVASPLPPADPKIGAAHLGVNLPTDRSCSEWETPPALLMPQGHSVRPPPGILARLNESRGQAILPAGVAEAAKLADSDASRMLEAERGALKRLADTAAEDHGPTKHLKMFDLEPAFNAEPSLRERVFKGRRNGEIRKPNEAEPVGEDTSLLRYKAANRRLETLSELRIAGRKRTLRDEAVVRVGPEVSNRRVEERPWHRPVPRDLAGQVGYLYEGGGPSRHIKQCMYRCPHGVQCSWSENHAVPNFGRYHYFVCGECDPDAGISD